MKFKSGDVVQFIIPQFPWEIGDTVIIGEPILDQVGNIYSLLKYIDVKFSEQRPFDLNYIIDEKCIALFCVVF